MTLTSSQVQSPGPLLSFTAIQPVCTITTDANQSTPSVTIYNSQRPPYGHTSTLDNASGLNSFSFYLPSFAQLNAGGILGNQTFRPNVTSASRIQTDQGSITPIDLNNLCLLLRTYSAEVFCPQLML